MAIPKDAPLSHYAGRKPKPLAWMERRYARVAGEIYQLEQDIAAGVRRLKEARAERDELAMLLRSTAIDVNPAEIAPIRPQRVQRALPHGEPTRQLLTCLRNAEAPVSTFGLTAYVIGATGLRLSEAERAVFQNLVRKRLGHLQAQGKIRRTNPTKAGWMGVWELALK
jgi:hypothetical protein